MIDTNIGVIDNLQNQFNLFNQKKDNNQVESHAETLPPQSNQNP